MEVTAYDIDCLKRELAEAQAEIKRLRKITAQIADLSFENQALKARLYEIQKCAKNAQKVLSDCELLSIS